jgi:hypothetical protein
MSMTTADRIEMNLVQQHRSRYLIRVGTTAGAGTAGEDRPRTTGFSTIQAWSFNPLLPSASCLPPCRDSPERVQSPTPLHDGSVRRPAAVKRRIEDQ